MNKIHVRLNNIIDVLNRGLVLMPLSFISISVSGCADNTVEETVQFDGYDLIDYDYDYDIGNDFEFETYVYKRTKKIDGNIYFLFIINIYLSSPAKSCSQ